MITCPHPFEDVKEVTIQNVKFDVEDFHIENQYPDLLTNMFNGLDTSIATLSQKYQFSCLGGTCDWTKRDAETVDRLFNTVSLTTNAMEESMKSSLNSMLDLTTLIDHSYKLLSDESITDNSVYMVDNSKFSIWAELPPLEFKPSNLDDMVDSVRFAYPMVPTIMVNPSQYAFIANLSLDDIEDLSTPKAPMQIHMDEVNIGEEIARKYKKKIDALWQKDPIPYMGSADLLREDLDVYLSKIVERNTPLYNGLKGALWKMAKSFW